MFVIHIAMPKNNTHFLNLDNNNRDQAFSKANHQRTEILIYILCVHNDNRKFDVKIANAT